MDTSRLDAQTISQRLMVDLRTAECHTIPIILELGYSAADPYTVAISFHPDDRPVRWEFARDLLTDGLREPAGDGDVHAWPCLDDHGNAVVVVELCSPNGDALVEIRLGDAFEFVDRMHGLVAPGEESEHLDIDAAILAIYAAEV
jgi:Streptomyces sporulation and cell division protein, SsgA